MKPDPSLAMAAGNDPAVRAASQCLVGFNIDGQGDGSLGDGGDMNAWDAKDGIGEGAPGAVPAGSRVGHVRVFYAVGSLVATYSKRP